MIPLPKWEKPSYAPLLSALVKTIIFFILQNFSMAGIAFNLILIRVGQNRSNVNESCLCAQRVTKEGQLSTLQFNITIAATQDQSLATVEEGVQKH